MHTQSQKHIPVSKEVGDEGPVPQPQAIRPQASTGSSLGPSAATPLPQASAGAPPGVGGVSRQPQAVQPQASTGSPLGVRTAASLSPTALNGAGSAVGQPQAVQPQPSTGSPIAFRTDVQQQPQAMQPQTSGGSAVGVRMADDAPCVPHNGVRAAPRVNSNPY